MKQGTPGFVGERLREAREARGLTLSSLSELLNVSAQAISQYEHEKTSPRPDVTIRIAEKLRFPAAFLFLPVTEQERVGTVFWRSMAASTSSARSRASRRVSWLRRFVSYVERFLTLPELRIPAPEISSAADATSERIESAAASLRAAWGLGSGPVTNVIHLLENNGVITLRFSLRSPTLDAFSEWEHHRPIVVIDRDKPAARSRWDAAHELGHMLMHRGTPDATLRKGPDFRAIEDQAHYFAGAFLLPADRFADDFVSPSIDHLLALKAKWNVSMAAMVMRAKHLDLLTPNEETRFWRSYSRRGFRRREPFDDSVVPEEPALLPGAFDLILTKRIASPAGIASALCMEPDDIEEVAFLPPGTLGGAPKLDVSEAPETPDVIPFPRRSI